MKKKDINVKFRVWWIENGTTSFQLHQGFALLVVLEPVWSSSFLSIIPKIGKPWNLFSSISLVNSHFIRFSLLNYHFFSKMSQLHNVSLNEHQLVMTISTYTLTLVDYQLPLLISKNWLITIIEFPNQNLQKIPVCASSFDFTFLA